MIYSEHAHCMSHVTDQVMNVSVLEGACKQVKQHKVYTPTHATGGTSVTLSSLLMQNPLIVNSVTPLLHAGYAAVPNTRYRRKEHNNQ
jgi:hypothetical protein